MTIANNSSTSLRSCSKPLNVGDRFGAITLVDMELYNKKSPSDVRRANDFCPPCVVCCRMADLVVRCRHSSFKMPLTRLCLTNSSGDLSCTRFVNTNFKTYVN